jgi:hypothetical protein
MTAPIEILGQRLHEISISLKQAYKNDLPKEDIEKLIKCYNEYYTSIQLIGSHLDISFKYSKLIITKTGYLGYKFTVLKRSIYNSKKYEKTPNCLS